MAGQHRGSCLLHASDKNGQLVILYRDMIHIKRHPPDIYKLDSLIY